MPRPEHEREAVEWYLFAMRDLKDAHTLADSDRSNPNAVWHAQQAAEKAIKSLLVLGQIPFKWTHDLEALRAALPDDYRLKTIPNDLSPLSQRGMESRCPGDYDLLEEVDVRQALSLAGEVIDLLKEEFDPQVLAGVDPATGEPYAD